MKVVALLVAAAAVFGILIMVAAVLGTYLNQLSKKYPPPDDE